MERVQFEQEQMLDELKDLVEKGIFTPQETKEIVKRRTAFETVLVRRVAKKADYIRYVTYEMTLEELRKKRIDRLKIDTRPPTISSYSIVRRQFHIFERALKKFKDDVGLWIQYIELAKKEGAKSLVGRICARAIHLHPSTPSLYILAAEHELSTSQSPSAARVLLQRGIRLNKESIDMWREWVRMELSFIEGLRRRWEVLGIQKGTISTGADEGMEDVRPVEKGMEEEAEMERIANQDGGEGESARLHIMKGAIVKTVITAAAEALPKLSLFSALEEVIENHPSPDELKKEALGHLYTVLRECMGMEAGAVNMLAWRHLEPVRGASSTKGKAKAAPDDNVAPSVGQVGDGDALRDREGREEATEGREEARLTHTVELVEAVRQANEEYLYPVQQQPFSHFQFKDIRRPNDIHPITLPKSSSTRSSTIRPLFAPSPIDIPRNLPSDSSISSASPPTPSTKLPLPRSPYISSRQILPSPIPTGTGKTPLPVERPTSGASSIASSTIEDVFYPGDIVGEDALLQGEPIRLVSIGSTSQSCAADYVEPAKEFEVVRRLGTGSYAVVYLVREVLSRSPPSDDSHGHMSLLGSMEMDGPISQQGTEYGREFAIKCLSKANLDDDALAAQMSEVTIHQSLQAHPNIVTLHRTLETSSFLLLVLEFVPGEDLFYFLEQARDHYESDYPTDPSDSPSRTPPTPSLLSTLDPAQLLSRTRLRLISSMFAQMCDAVAACHAQQVFHRDIKPENFIVTDGYSMLPNGRIERKVIVKLTDFGLSTTDIQSSDMDCGSAPYMSYECRNNMAPIYRPRAADVWSLGIVLINMLYHFNPWTDTSEGACPSFTHFRQRPVYFLMSSFVGMTRPVAEFLATRVFCILEDPSDDSRRISAAEFGQWARDLPALLGVPGSVAHSRSGSLTGAHPLSTATQISYRPCSRPPSRCASNMAMLTPAGGQTRSLSRAPSLGPAFEREEAMVAAELSTVMDEEQIQELEVDADVDQSLATAASGTTDGASIIGTESRSTSTNKRRKRGARKGKGIAQPPTTPQDATLETLAVASQSLARELSHASKHGSVKSGSSSMSASTSRRRPFEPVAMYPVPTPLLSLPARPPSSLPATKSSTGTNTNVPQQVPVKKPSKWKLSFGKASAPVMPSNASIASSMPNVDDTASTMSSIPPSLPTDSVLSFGSQTSKTSRGSKGSDAPSATASNVANLLMGLNAPPPSVGSSAYSIKSSSDDSLPWPRGRRPRASPAASTVNVNINSLSVPANKGGSRSRGPPGLSTSPHRERRNERATSPNSTRSGRPLASSASSMTSSNWRNSMSTTSSAGTSTSAFTRYSNSSMGSVSTAATSVSSASWRTGGAKSNPSSPNVPAYRPPTLPKNIKFMTGVPWELNELPRGLHPNPVGDIFGSPPVRKQRTRKPKDLKLDTINERVPAQRSPEYPRRDASTSTTDLTSTYNVKDDADGPKKVQKGQINTLAKMLSALRR
ncbi:hypothetical protein EYR38_006806 [Pleurotus pulmonarius]|nr:hypothetical protein EYR38_006806 [Pleurotus pulmonarius]